MKAKITTPCIISSRGNLSNHHFAIDPIWGEIIADRVTEADATHFIIVEHGKPTRVVSSEEVPARPAD